MRLVTILLSLLPSLALGTAPAPHLTPWEQIHQTLHTYPLAIDLKNPSLFSSVFAPNAFANYTGPLSNLTGLPAISTALTASVAKLLSQHALSTIVIDIHPGLDTANSTTYFTASLFGTGASAGQVVYLYGLYADELVKLEQGWRIRDRLLVFLAPITGNSSLLGG